MAKRDRTDKPLTDREWVFVQEYLHTGSVRGACSTAGYGVSTRNAILKRPHIRAAVDRAQKQIANRVQRTVDITVEKVLMDLEDARIGAIGSLQFNAAIHASELHGRHIGMFREDFGDRDSAPMIVINNVIEGPGGTRTVVRVVPSPDLPRLPEPSTLPDPPMEEITDADLIWEK